HLRASVGELSSGIGEWPYFFLGPLFSIGALGVVLVLLPPFLDIAQTSFSTARQPSVKPWPGPRSPGKSSTRCARLEERRPSTINTGTLSRRMTESPACGTSIVIFSSPA